MGQQGAAQHQPIGLGQGVAFAANQLPRATGNLGEMADQGAVVGIDGACSRTNGQQSLAELVHPANAAVEPAQAKDIGLAELELGFPLEACHRTSPGLNPAARHQGLQQRRIGLGGEVEQGGSVVNSNVLIKPGTPGTCPPPGASPGFPKADRRAHPQATQLGYQSAASHSGTDDGDGLGHSNRRIL